MIQYVVHVLPQIPAGRWFVLIVLLVVIIGGKCGYSYLLRSNMEPDTGCCTCACIAFILWATLFLRAPGTEHQANLSPMWSWYQGFFGGNDEIRWQIYLNILLFMPFGFFSYLGKARPLGRILLRGFLLSLLVEACQYLFCLGLFEWDDLLHNSFGCLMGSGCGKIVKRVGKLHRLHKTHGRK